MKKKKSFIFTNKKHSQRAIMATILGIISMVSMIIVVMLSYKADGVAKNGYGFTGLLAMLFSVIGLVLGLVTAFSKKYYRLFPTLAIVLNLLNIAGIGMVLYWGAN